MLPSNDHDFAPGTVRLLDSDSLEVVATTKEAVVLIPAPSSDCNDPVNWTSGRKTVSLLCLIAYITTCCLAGGALYAIYAPLTDSTGLTFAQLNEGVGYTYFTFGVGSLFSMPLAVVIGKRPVYIISLIGQGAVMVWAAYTVGNGQWIANRILLGFFGAPDFTLVAVSVADLYFLHERGFYMGVYMMLLYVAPLLAPMIGSGLFQATNYKVVLILAGGLCFVVAIICFVFMEETNYIRQLPIPGPPPTEESLGGEGGDVEGEKEVHGTKMPTLHSVQDVPTAPSHATDHRTLVGTPKTFVQRMGFQKVRPGAAHTFYLGIVQPLLSVVSLPLLWWGSFQYGIYQVWFNLGNAYASITLSAPPYNFSPVMVGLSYWGPILVTVPCALVAGTMSDRLALWFAKRNHGISEPEHKLWLTLPLLLAGPFGLLMMGMGAYFELHWIVFVIGISVVIGLGPLATLICVNYMFDSFHGVGTTGSSSDEAAPFFIGSMIPAMLLAFGFNYAFTPWLDALGYKLWGVTTSIVFVVSVATTFPIIKYGKGMRRRGKDRYLRILAL